MEVPQMLGQRIVEAARLMVAAHLQASLESAVNFRQQVVIGGAGPTLAGVTTPNQGDSFTDEALPNTSANRTRGFVAPADGGAE